MRLIEPCRPATRWFAKIEIDIVVARDVSRLLRALDFLVILLNDAVLNHLATAGIDRMRNVGVKFGAPFRVFRGAAVVLPGTALIAEARPQMVFHAALRAMRCQLATGHSDERSVRAVDDLQIAYDKAVFERDG